MIISVLGEVIRMDHNDIVGLLLDDIMNTTTLFDRSQAVMTYKEYVEAVAVMESIK